MDVLYKTSSGVMPISLEAKHMSKRLISIKEDITPQSAVDFTDRILELNMESTEPITCLITTSGGDIKSGLMMYDAIVGSRAPVRMVCRGMAYSMGAVLFAAASERLMLPNSELMLHQPFLGGRVSGNASEIKNISDSLLKEQAKINRLIAAHTGKTEEQVAEAASYDHYFSPQEAIAFNLCDRSIDFGEILDLICEE